MYLLSFVEEGIYNPKYKDYVGGRIEVFECNGSGYNIEEIRFFTKNKAWYKFREKWDCAEIPEIELDKIRDIVKKKYLKKIFI